MSLVAHIVKTTLCMIMVCTMMFAGSGCAQQVNGMFRPKMVRLYDKTISSVVRIHIVYNGKLYGGTGVFVSPGVIVTAGHLVGAYSPHVVLAPNMITVMTHTGRRLEVVECFDENPQFADLGILRVKMPKDFQPYYPKMDFTTAVGDEIFVIGAPAGIYPIMTYGHIAGPLHSGMPPESFNMQIDCSVNGGNSGGPVFDMGGDLIGIVVANPFNTIGLSWCERAVTVKKTLHNWRNGLTLPKVERGHVCRR